MGAVDLIGKLRGLGVKIWLEENALRYQAPKGVMTSELLTEFAAGKQELLDFLRQIKQETRPIQEIIPVIPRDQAIPLSYSQQRIWVLHQMEPHSAAYNIVMAFRITGDLDLNAFEASLQKVIERQESLRTTFTTVHNQPAQIIAPSLMIPVAHHDLSGLPPAEREARLSGLMKEEADVPFDLSQGPLLRCNLFKLAGQEYVLLLAIDHIISDGGSFGVFWREFKFHYEAQIKNTRGALPDLPVQYADFAAWQRRWLESGKSLSSGPPAAENINQDIFPDSLIRQEEFWLERLAGEAPVLNIPTDFPRPGIQSYEGACFRFNINRELAVKMKETTANLGLTLYMFLLSAFNVLLSKYSGQDDMLIGTPIFGRPYRELEAIIGMFMNTLVIRSFPQAEKGFADFAQEVKTDVLAAYDHQYYQFEMLLEKLNVKRDISRNPLIDVMFTYQAYENIPISGLAITPYPLDTSVTKFDLMITAAEDWNSGIGFTIEYCTKLFLPETVERLSRHLLNIISEVVDNPSLKIKDITMLSPEERRQLLVDFNNTRLEYPPDATAVRMFHGQAQKTPDHIALIFEEQALTYRELDERSTQLARVIRARGIKSGNIAGVLLRRSPEMIISILAILKAGAAYLPLDPEYPKDRIEYMLSDSQALLLLTEPLLMAELKLAKITAPLLNVFDPAISAESKEQLESVVAPESLAYLIYTSGSTGKPKGTMIEHWNLTNFIYGITGQIPFEPGRSILGLTTISFDIFALETFVPLTRGLKIVMAGEKQQSDPALLLQLIAKHAINIIQITPSRLKLVLGQDGLLDKIPGLEILIVGGEAFPEPLFHQVKGMGLAAIYNVYGPTETTVWSTVKNLTAENRITIGRPIANTRIYIVNNHGQLQPVGVPGELWIAGDGVVRGYFNRDDLTRERMIKSPFKPDEKVYRTGDLARWLPNGDIEFLGRLDHQIKIRGFRIEPGEIEALMLGYEGITEAVTAIRENKEGQRLLCAYFKGNRRFSITELRDYLSRELPYYMIPEYFIQLEEFPLTPNGKIDRKALTEANKLPDPEISRSQLGNTYAAPETDLEKTIAAIWSEVLQVKEVGLNDSFFDLGGNSMILTQANRLLNERLPAAPGKEIPVMAMFQYPTIKTLIQYLNLESGRSIPPTAPKDLFETDLKKAKTAMNQTLQSIQRRGAKQP